MVSQAHTRPYPRAMMIHSHDALAAKRAVMCSWWLDFFAFSAVSVLHELFWSKYVECSVSILCTYRYLDLYYWSSFLILSKKRFFCKN